MFDLKLLAGLGDGLGIEIRQAGAVADDGRPVDTMRPEPARFFRVIGELGLAGAGTAIALPLKLHGPPPGGANREQSNPAIGVLEAVRLDSGVGLQMGGQPGQQILIALGFGDVRIESSADHGVAGILDAKDQIAAGLVQ